MRARRPAWCNGASASPGIPLPARSSRLVGAVPVAVADPLHGILGIAAIILRPLLVMYRRRQHPGSLVMAGRPTWVWRSIVTSAVLLPHDEWMQRQLFRLVTNLPVPPHSWRSVKFMVQ